MKQLTPIWVMLMVLVSTIFIVNIKVGNEEYPEIHYGDTFLLTKGFYKHCELEMYYYNKDYYKGTLTCNKACQGYFEYTLKSLYDDNGAVLIVN